MRKAGLRGCPKRRFRVTTQRDPSHPVAANLLKQDFTAEGPNQRWASDITYISTHRGWLYLAVVMDLYSRKIVGWSMSRRINRHLVIDALSMAIGARQPEGTLVHHSDRGSQYTSDDFREELDEQGIQCSMSGRGNCYDNAVVESFFGILNVNVLIEYATELENKPERMCSITSRCSTTANAATVTWVTSVRWPSRNGQAVDSKWSIKTG